MGEAHAAKSARHGKRGLVLSGGGSRGVYQAGVTHGLAECDFHPEVVAGTSVGAINAAFYASGIAMSDYGELWQKLSSLNVFPYRKDVWNIPRWMGYASQATLEKFLHTHLDIKAIRKGPTELRVTATDLCCGKSVVWDESEVQVKHLLASAAVPGVFDPVEIDGHQYLDGALLRFTPVTPAMEAGCDHIIAVIARSMTPGKIEQPKNLRDVVSRIAEMYAQASLDHEIEMIQAGIPTRMMGLFPRRFKPRFEIISPSQSIPGSLLEFNPKYARKMYALGYEDGTRYCNLDLQLEEE